MNQPDHPQLQQSPVSAYYHTHWDREWYLPFRAYQVRLATVVDEILERLENKVLPCFMLDGQTVVLEDYLELRPENRQRLKQLIADGRLSIGPWYVMPDEFLVSGESLIRNLVRGIQESRAWGCNQFTGYLPDTFGHSADIPTLLRQVGIDSSVIWRGIDPKHSLFFWQSPSGAKVKTLHLTDGYFQMMLHDWTATNTQKEEALSGLTDKLTAVRLQDGPVLLPIGGDHLAPVSAEGHSLLKAQQPDLQETTPDRYLHNIPSKPTWDTIQGELVENSGSFLLPGVYSARMYLKQANRKLEHLLIHKLEPLLALAQMTHWPKTWRYPIHELDLAWKTLILNHPHDSICGCSVDEVHRENEVRFDQVRQLAESMLNRTVSLFTEHLADEQSWIIWNMGQTPYTGVVPAVEDRTEDNQQASQLIQVESEQTVLQDEFLHDSHRIPLSHLTKTRRTGWIWAESVPAMGYKIIPKSPQSGSAKFRSVEVEPRHLRNGLISIQIEQNGHLTISDLQTGKSYSKLLQFQLIQEQGDSYNSAPVPGSSIETSRFISSKVFFQGPLVGAIELTHEIDGLQLKTQVRLQAESPLVSLQTTFTNQSPNIKLQVGFSTDQPITTVTAESHLSLVTRHYDPTYQITEHMPVEKMKELKTNTGPVQRFFSTNGQSFITQGLAEYEVFQDTLWITLHRGFSHLSKADTGVRGAQAGPPFETPEGQCLNRTFECHYAWLPTPNAPSQLYEQAIRFYGNVWAESGKNKGNMQINADAGLFHLENSSIVTSACYWSAGQGVILRLINPTQQTQMLQIQPQFPFRQASEVNFLEEPTQEISVEALSFEPNEVKTVLFEV